MEDMYNKIFEKKMDYSNTASKDFELPNELSVRITLREYRELVSSNATKQNDIDKANSDKWKLQDENRRLKEEIDVLREKLVNLMDKCTVDPDPDAETEE